MVSHDRVRSMDASLILNIAVPSPLLRTFDYLPPPGVNADQLIPGVRVRIPFGNSSRIGLIISHSQQSELALNQLKAVDEVLDTTPILDDALLNLLQWASRYYHHSLGNVLSNALPTLLRQGQPARLTAEPVWSLTAAGQSVDAGSLGRAPRQAELLRFLQQLPAADGPGVDSQRLAAVANWRPAMKALQAKGWVSVCEQTIALAAARRTPIAPPHLNAQQQAAVDTISPLMHHFQCCLLDGVTGSGKTEVYFQLIAQQLQQQRQVLVLVPEIGLTPQLVERFQQRFNQPMVVLHSALSDRERLNAWLHSRLDEAKIIIGTRSAVFVPCPRLGLIIIDEEHDASFKQQDGFRYHARDIAIVRAQQSQLPIVLGSATPSLESLYNAQQQRYLHLRLTERTGVAALPAIELVDVRHLPLTQGLSPRLLQAMHQHLEQDSQVLLFLNRRGFAPTVLCHDCGWVARCERCDAHLIYHQQRGVLRCHHCDAQRRFEAHCPSCQGTALSPLGHGTERIEQALHEQFPQCDIIRIDRDSLRGKNALQDLFARIKQGQKQILLGTQMLAKGHDLPNVTLVGIITADQGLFSIDFRASERLGQMVIQVAGRAGRSDRPGEVLIQTHHPHHPLLQCLQSHDYAQYAHDLLIEREQAQLPPFSHMALLRAEATSATAPQQFLASAAKAGMTCRQQLAIDILGPVPAPMERRAGRYRAQLIIQAPQRQLLQKFLAMWMTQVHGIRGHAKVRWSLDVDPVDMM